jgi:hypothetical protein
MLSKTVMTFKKEINMCTFINGNIYVKSTSPLKEDNAKPFPLYKKPVFIETLKLAEPPWLES